MSDTSFRDAVLRCLGGAWPAGCDLNVRELALPAARDGYVLHTISFDAEPGDAVPCYLLVPVGVDADHPAPAIAVWHQHNGQWELGKSEPAGLAGNPMHHTGVALAREGYVVLCPDALTFEERQDATGRLRGGDYERFEFLRYVVSGRSLAWKNILDMKRAVDVLVSRPEVRADRIGCYGHSMGATHTWLLGPWEERLTCLVANCCLPTYRAIHRAHMLHCFSNFIPGLFAHGDTPDVAALIAPKPLHMNFGEHDAGSPIDEVRRAVAVIADAYTAAGAAEHFSYTIEQGAGHVLSPLMWQHTRRFFAQHLASA